MNRNKNLLSAKSNRYDEFYTLKSDVEQVLYKYGKFFRGKVIYTNADNPKRSNFYLVLKEKFHDLGLKSLVSTYYSKTEKVYKTVFDGKKEIQIPLKTNGDFRSPELIETVKSADIIFTNPPFSLARAFLDMFDLYDKKFLMLGHNTLVKYKRKIHKFMDLDWFVYGGVGWFLVPPDYNGKTKIIDDKKVARVNTFWFTNLGKKEGKKLKISDDFKSDKYRKLENGVLECKYIRNIPKKYNGEIAVPLTIFKYDYSEYEVLYLINDPFLDNGKNIFARVIIKRKRPYLDLF